MVALKHVLERRNYIDRRTARSAILRSIVGYRKVIGDADNGYLCVAGAIVASNAVYMFRVVM